MVGCEVFSNSVLNLGEMVTCRSILNKSDLKNQVCCLRAVIENKSGVRI